MSNAGSTIYKIAAITMGVMLYMLISVILIDILRLFSSWQPQTYGLTAISLALLVSIYGIWNSTNMKTSRIEIPIPGLKKEISAIHLSDIHIGHFRAKDFLGKIVDKTNSLDPDVVFITGDLFDGRINLTEENIQLLKHIKAPVFFVEGNHDIYTGVGEIKALLRKNDIHVLENEMVRWDGLQIVGLNHMIADHNSVNIHASKLGNTIQKVLQDLPIKKEEPSILLHHSPEGIQYASEHGINLYLSGHTHAGQLFPINFISDKLFEYNRGLHHFNGTHIYVSEGAGTFGPPMRIATKSEITLINLVPDNHTL
jgi:predicted MPP superfamily phosphohydrolase